MVSGTLELSVCAVLSLFVPQSALHLSGSAPRRNWQRTPNVLVVYLDDVGVDKMASYGYGVHYPRMPAIDALIAAGVRFDHAYSNPVCGPARSCLLTGRHAFRTGFGDNTVDIVNPYNLPPQEVALGEYLHLGRPYGKVDVALFGKQHLSTSDGSQQNDTWMTQECGFDVFYGHLANTSDVGGNQYDWRRVQDEPPFYSVDTVGTPLGPWDSTTYVSSVVRSALSTRLAALASSSEPFVALWCPNPPHAPFQVPPHDGTGYDQDPPGQSLLSQKTIDGERYPTDVFPPEFIPLQLPSELSARQWAQSEGLDVQLAQIQWFDAAVEAFDRELALLLSGMDPAQLAHTLIVVTSDNGTPTAAMESVQSGHGPFDESRAKGTIYELGTRVPLVVANVGSFLYSGSPGAPAYSTTPGDLPYPVAPSRTSDALVHVVDIFRTIGEVCRVEEELAIPPTTAIDGLSFLDLLKDPDAVPPRDRILVERFSPSGSDPTRIHRAFHDGTYKYVLHDDELGLSEEFYRIASDPWEAFDLKRSQAWTPEEEAIFYALQEEMALLLQS